MQACMSPDWDQRQHQCVLQHCGLDAGPCHLMVTDGGGYAPTSCVRARVAKHDRLHPGGLHPGGKCLQDVRAAIATRQWRLT